MASPQQLEVLIFGTGSIGAVYLYQLQQAGCRVTAVCRSNYSIVNKQGFTLNSIRFGNVTYKPDHVVRDVAECSSTIFDYVVVCSKSFPNSKPSLADMLRPVLTDRPTTTIVLAQNGIMIEEEISIEYPQNPLLSGVIYCPATQTDPGTIEYPEMLNLLEIGTYPSNAPAHHKSAAKSFADLMIAGGGEAQVHEDIQPARWAKLLMNAVWNPICALTLCTDGEFLTTSTPFAHDLAWNTMREVILLAWTLGIDGVTEEVAREKFRISSRRTEMGTGRAMSMLQDVRLGRALEVEAILGNVVRIARGRRVEVPRLETLYALVNARNVVMGRERESERERMSNGI